MIHLMLRKELSDIFPDAEAGFGWQKSDLSRIEAFTSENVTAYVLTLVVYEYEMTKSRPTIRISPNISIPKID